MRTACERSRRRLLLGLTWPVGGRCGGFRGKRGMSRHGQGPDPGSRRERFPFAVSVPSSPLSGFDLLAVSEEEPWTVAVAAPVAASLRVGDRVPLLIALSNPPTHEAEELVELAAPRRPLVLATAAAPKLGRALPKRSPEVWDVGADPVRGSLAVAKRFWGRPRRAVVAASEDAEGILFGAALAARMSIPLLLRERTESRTSLAAALRELGVEEAFAAVADPERAAAMVQCARQVQHQGDDAPGGPGPRDRGHRSGRVRTIVVARVPEKRATVGLTAWLAPYLALVRGAPMVLSHARRRRRWPRPR